MSGCGENEFEKTRRKALSGDSEAQYALGVLYGRGKGIEQDLEQVFMRIEKSAKQGNATAQFALGSLYISENNLVDGKHWWGKAAAQEYQPAKDFLSRYE